MYQKCNLISIFTLRLINMINLEYIKKHDILSITNKNLNFMFKFIPKFLLIYLMPLMNA